MSSFSVYPIQRISGTPKIPGDKSISHRALLFGALAHGKTSIHHLLESEDVFSTWKCLENLGVTIEKKVSTIEVTGRGLKNLKSPSQELDCGNSGTTLRLLMGILSGCPFATTLTGDSSLKLRPMRRIAAPLSLMGAQFRLREDQFAPLTVIGKNPLVPVRYELPIASAQLKSALLLAGLSTEGRTTLTGKIQSRDHTERLLPSFGAKLEVSDDSISISGGQTLYGTQVQVPGDFSSAAFWIAAGILVPNSRIEIRNVSLNPSRMGLLHVLRKMGARIEIEMTHQDPEPIGVLFIQSSSLQGIAVNETEVPSLIDELPLLAVLATFAEGPTLVRGAEELRVKETDRIEAVAINLRRMGGKIDTLSDGFRIEGPQLLHGAKLDSFHDHRIAMSFAIAALRAQGPCEIQNTDCVNISYPGFFSTLRQLVQTD